MASRAAVTPPTDSMTVMPLGGGKTSATGIESDVAARLPLPAASVNVLAAKPMDAVPANDAVGVKVAVYEVPDPAKLEIVPPVTVTSAAVKSVAASLSVNVTVVVSPIVSGLVPERVMVTVGATVSTGIESDVAAKFPLPAASVNVLAAKPMDAVPANDAVGVKVAV